MNVSLRPLEDRDLDTIYQQVTDPESIRMAAFTAEDQTDRRAFLDRMSRVLADTSASNRASVSMEQSLERSRPSESTISSR
jgi:hypothetical protein